jgi:alcohol dehydrogenase, propanol-preferring
MKAIRFVGVHQPATIADVPAPRPGSGEVVVAVNAAIAAVRNGGRVVLVGLGANEVNLPTLALIRRQISVAGAWGSTRQELVEVVDFIAAGRISSPMEQISLDEGPAGYERLRRGKVAGRLVALVGQ